MTSNTENPPALVRPYAETEHRCDVLAVVTAAVADDPAWVDSITADDPFGVARWFDAKPLDGGLVALIGDDVVGFAGLWAGDPSDRYEGRWSQVQMSSGPWIELCRVVVDPAHRRRGVGLALSNAARTEIGRRGASGWLSCVDDHTADFWSAVGWFDHGPVVYPADVDSRPGRLFVSV